MLPNSYQEALRAMKDQAQAVAMQIVGDQIDRNAGRFELADAQQRMAQYPNATKEIARLLMGTKDETLTIETLDEKRLEHELGADYLAQFGRTD
jgi:hypothetical protein